MHRMRQVHGSCFRQVHDLRNDDVCLILQYHMAFHEAKICCSRSLNRGHRNLTDRDSCNKGLHDNLHKLY